MFQKNVEILHVGQESVFMALLKKKYKIKKSTGIQKNQYITLNLQHLYASLSRAVEWTRPRA